MAAEVVYPKQSQPPELLRECLERVHFDRDRLRDLCRASGISRLEIFGSALRKDFHKGSDIDLLATLRPEAHPTLLDWVDIQQKLSEVFRRPVDLLSRRAVERSQNPYRRSAILSTTVPVYVEG